MIGDVVRPADAGYKKARLGWNKLYCHCIEGWSAIDGGLVIDVSRMESTEFDEAD